MAQGLYVYESTKKNQQQKQLLKEHTGSRVLKTQTAKPTHHHRHTRLQSVEC